MLAIEFPYLLVSSLGGVVIDSPLCLLLAYYGFVPYYFCKNYLLRPVCSVHQTLVTL